MALSLDQLDYFRTQRKFVPVMESPSGMRPEETKS